MIRWPLIFLVLTWMAPDDTVELRPHWKVGDVVRQHLDGRNAHARKRVLQQPLDRAHARRTIRWCEQGNYFTEGLRSLPANAIVDIPRIALDGEGMPKAILWTR